MRILYSLPSNIHVTGQALGFLSWEKQLCLEWCRTAFKAPPCWGRQRTIQASQWIEQPPKVFNRLGDNAVGRASWPSPSGGELNHCGVFNADRCSLNAGNQPINDVSTSHRQKCHKLCVGSVIIGTFPSGFIPNGYMKCLRWAQGGIPCRDRLAWRKRRLFDDVASTAAVAARVRIATRMASEDISQTSQPNRSLLRIADRATSMSYEAPDCLISKRLPRSDRCSA